jgi:hypothetical protein
MNLQDELTKRMKQIIKDEPEPAGFWVIQSGVVWDFHRSSWVLVLELQDQETLKVEPFKTVEL